MLKTLPGTVRGHLVLGFTVLCMLSVATTRLAADDHQEQWNVLLITVDCLRPDHMSLYGYGRDTTPNLEKFAEESLVFENAFSTSAWTSPGVLSLLTGYYPPVHAQTSRHSFYDAEMASPLRVLSEEGYRILGKNIDGPTLDNVGFQRKLRTNVTKSLHELDNLAESWSPEGPPFFAWVHIKPTHLPYRPSEKNASLWIDTSRQSPGVDAARDHWLILRPTDVSVDFKHYSQGVQFVDDDIPVIRALFDGEVVEADEELGRVLQRMRESGLLDRTIVIITADHGEELFEHGWIGHASTSYDGKLYDELIRIPLLIRLPDQSQTGRFDALVQGVDIMPTIFDLLGIESERMEPAMQGRSLVPLIEGEETQLRDHLFNETTLKGWTTPEQETDRRVLSVRSRAKKLIRSPEGDGYRTEAYDLDQDPSEQNDVYPTRAAEFAGLEQALTDWQARNRTAAAKLVQTAADKQLAKLMQALADGDLMEATKRWQDIEVMNRTWGLEVDPFYEHAPYAEPWRDTRREAAGLIAAAMACAADGGTWHPVQNGDSGQTAMVACEP